MRNFINQKITYYLVMAMSLIWASSANAQPYVPDTREFPGSAPLSFTSNPLLDLSDGGAIEFWVAADWSVSPGYHPTLLNRGVDPAPLYRIAISASREELLLQFGSKHGRVPFDFSDGQTHHVALLDFDDEVMVMIDGWLAGGVAMSIEPGPPAPLIVGANADGSAPFIGAISALRFWHSPMAPETIAAYALKDPTDPSAPHPDLAQLAAYSDFELGELILADHLIVPNMSDAEVLAALGEAELKALEDEIGVTEEEDNE